MSQNKKEPTDNISCFFQFEMETNQNIESASLVLYVSPKSESHIISLKHHYHFFLRIGSVGNENNKVHHSRKKVDSEILHVQRIKKASGGCRQSSILFLRLNMEELQYDI